MLRHARLFFFYFYAQYSTSGGQTISSTVYPTISILCRYSKGLIFPHDTLILFSLYKKTPYLKSGCFLNLNKNFIMEVVGVSLRRLRLLSGLPFAFSATGSGAFSFDSITFDKQKTTRRSFHILVEVERVKKTLDTILSSMNSLLP